MAQSTPPVILVGKNPIHLKHGVDMTPLTRLRTEDGVYQSVGVEYYSQGATEENDFSKQGNR
ncbi:hypothetical protein GN958_ATG21095 [Phytophthora infestans]|uniref:Uncharacterized protein n=1 Tax=Phytophthora infestans TaxID=4787 RepID=A0A8S9TMC1_PHYIN|nr:hypothetical protein GN958_ATG21095 [Phytophthora infestans]